MTTKSHMTIAPEAAQFCEVGLDFLCVEGAG